MSKEVVLTGLRSNSEFHLGNYLGGILPVISMQQQRAGQYQVNMFVPDLHSFTTPIEHGQLYRQTIDNLKVFVAAGLDIEHPDTYIYRQSFIPAHSELTWILDCFTGFGELERMTQFKEKINLFDAEEAIEDLLKINPGMDPKADHVIPVLNELRKMEKERRHAATAGLFNYPVLMAADILLYNARYVPVGDDQKQHLELTRDLAQRINQKFGEIFTVPERWQKQLEFNALDRGVRIRSLRQPNNKMSKSVSDPSGTILLSDDPMVAHNKIMKAETDNKGMIRYDFKLQPGISNLLQILALLTNESQETVNKEWEGKSSYGDLKKATAAAVESFLLTFQPKLELVDETRVLKKLAEDEKAMNEVANATLHKVQKAVGLRA